MNVIKSIKRFRRRVVAPCAVPSVICARRGLFYAVPAWPWDAREPPGPFWPRTRLGFASGRRFVYLATFVSHAPLYPGGSQFALTDDLSKLDRLALVP